MATAAAVGPCGPPPRPACRRLQAAASRGRPGRTRRREHEVRRAAYGRTVRLAGTRGAGHKLTGEVRGTDTTEYEPYGALLKACGTAGRACVRPVPRRMPRRRAPDRCRPARRQGHARDGRRHPRAFVTFTAASFGSVRSPCPAWQPIRAGPIRRPVRTPPGRRLLVPPPEAESRTLGRPGSEPSYVAAQAAAAGYPGDAAHRQGLAAETVRRGRTSTLLGDFTLDAGWRQVGHRVRAIRWRHGQMVPVDHGATGASGLD